MLALLRPSALVRLARWVRAWLSPIPGWSAVVRDFADGCRSWPAPGRPDVPNTMPWPSAWTLVRYLPPGEPGQNGHGYAVADTVSVSGRLARFVEGGARCARCGSPLALVDLALEEPPACWLCARLVARVARSAR